MDIFLGIDIPLYFLLLVLALVLLYMYGTWPYGLWRSMGIEGPTPEPYFGNQRQMNTKGFPECLHMWSRKYGRIYGIYLGRQPHLVISDLDILKEILVKDFARFSDRHMISLSPKPVQTGVFFAKGKDWKRIRTIITPTFSSGKMRLMEHFINRCAMDLADNLQEIACQGGKVNVKDYFGAYTMDVIAGTAFGLQVCSQKNLDQPFIANAKKLLTQIGTSNIFLLLITCLPFLGHVVRAMRTMLLKQDTMTYFLDHITHLVEERKRGRNGRPTDFLQLLIDAEADTGTHISDNGKTCRLTQDEVVGQAFLLFVAGYETTASTLQYLSYHLAKYPQVQNKIIQEIQEQLQDECPTYDNVRKLKFLEQTIYETLRLFPAVVMITRVASETITIKGVTIPKGAAVLVPISDIMWDPENFPHPEKFMPERFANSNKGEVNPISYLSFGYGPRLCIGMRLAILEIKMAMVHVLRKLKFVTSDDLPEKIVFQNLGSPVLRPVKPLLIKVEMQ